MDFDADMGDNGPVLAAGEIGKYLASILLELKDH